MTHRDPSPFQMNTSPREERETYFETLKKVDELAETLLTHGEPVAKDFFFRVSDPTVLTHIQLPPELSMRELESIRYEIQESADNNLGYASTQVVLEFADDDECRIYEPRPPYTEARYDLVSSDSLKNRDDSPVSVGWMSSVELSTLIARTLRPWDDPTRSDYSRLDIPGSRAEIIDILENNEFATSSKLFIFDLQGQEVAVTVDNGHVREVSVDQPSFDDTYRITLRTTFDTSAHAQELFIAERGVYRQSALTAPDIEAFRDVVDELLNILHASRHNEKSLESIYSDSDTNFALPDAATDE